MTHTRKGVAKKRRQLTAKERRDDYGLLSAAERLGRALKRGHKSTREVQRLRRGT